MRDDRLEKSKRSEDPDICVPPLPKLGYVQLSEREGRAGTKAHDLGMTSGRAHNAQKRIGGTAGVIYILGEPCTHPFQKCDKEFPVTAVDLRISGTRSLPEHPLVGL